MSQSTPEKLAFVSTNLKKFVEFRELLNIQELDIVELKGKERQDDNLEEIVRDKILLAKKVLGDTPFFVEHSGIELDAWKGLPGGLTRLFMDKVGPEGICKMLEGFGENQRTATAVSVIGFFNKQIGVKIFRGNAYGHITDAERESLDHEWDWDKIFIPSIGDNDKTYSQMGLKRKNEISMRKKVADDFREFLQNSYTFHQYENKLALKPEIIRDAENLVGMGKTKEALDMLFQHVGAMPSSAGRTSIISLKGKMNDLEAENTRGTLFSEEYNVRKNKIRSGLLLLIQSLS